MNYALKRGLWTPRRYSRASLRELGQKILVGGKFIGTLIRDGKIIDEFEDHNLVVNEGLNSLLNVYLNNSTTIPTWYMGVFEGNYTPVSSDTAATIAANSTESSAYTAGVRQTYTPAPPSAQQITNAGNRCQFTFNATKTMYGGLLVSTSAIGGTTGTLFAAARFGTPKAVVSGDQLLLTYAFTASSS